MRLITSSLVAAGAAAGIVGAVVTYQAVAGTPAAEQRPAAAAIRPADPTPAVKVTYLPCERGTKLVKGVCIRIKHRTVVREVPAAAPYVAPPSNPARSRNTRAAGKGSGEDEPAAPSSTRGDRDEADHESEDHGEEQESEHEDDHEDDHESEHEGPESDD